VAEEEERTMGKNEVDAVVTTTVLNRRVEVGDGRRGGAMWQARAEGEGERGGGSRPTGGWRPTDSGLRPAGAGGVT
jgi:hypothetical protein